MGQAVAPLTTFLNYILDWFKIETVVYMMDGIKNGRGVEELMKNADPLGKFENDSFLKALISQGDDFVDLYQNVLCDHPIGKYFLVFINEESAMSPDEDKNFSKVADIIRMYNMD